MAHRRPARRRGSGGALTITGVPRILIGVLGILLLVAALVYVFSARLVLTPTLTCEVQHPSLCRVWVNESADPVIAGVLLVIAALTLLMGITGRGWTFSFGGASLAPAAEARGMTPEDMPADTVAVAPSMRVLSESDRPGARAMSADATRGVTLFTWLPDDIRNAAAAKWASWYPDSPIGTALQEVRRLPGQENGTYFLRLDTPAGEDRWLKVWQPEQ